MGMSKTEKRNGKDTDRDSKGKFTEGNSYAAKPGEVRNPNGRRNAISDAIRKLGDLDNNREELMKTVYALAKAGDMRAIEFIAGYDQGKPIQTQVNIEGDVQPIKIIDVD